MAESQWETMKLKLFEGFYMNKGSSIGFYMNKGSSIGGASQNFLLKKQFNNSLIII